MRAIQVSGPGHLALVDVDRPVAGSGEVVVDVDAVGVCSTDRKFAGREHDRPWVIGHEVAGRLPDGTRVGIHPEIVCGNCVACRAGWENRCPERVSLGLSRDGGLAEAVVVPREQLLPLEDLDPVVGAMLEPLACAVHAIETAGIDAGAPAAVVGAGPMGILCMWVLQTRGSGVVVVQRSPRRRELALDLGADAAIGPDEDPAAALGAPPAAVVVTAPGPEPLSWALERAAVGGTVQAFAGSPGSAHVDANLVHYRHLRLVGSTGSRRIDHRRARDLVVGGEIKLDHLPHRVVRLDEAATAVLAEPPAGVLKTVVAVDEAVATDG